MNRHTITYWIFQTTGWTLYCLIYIFFYLTIRVAPQPYFFEQLITHVIIGFWLTHFMRWVIRRTGLLNLNIRKQAAALTFLSLVFSFMIGLCIVSTEKILGIQSENLTTYSYLNIATRFAFSYFHFVLIWNLLYFTYHYVQKTRQQNIDQAKLESLLKELEIKTLKSHINPQFLFNALNSIRSLVTEDPARARTAITQLSNILRSSIQVDKAEKILFEKELSIVKDYMALEQIRYADRLLIEYDIDEESLDQPVPAMVLQWLSDNALKHSPAPELHTTPIKIFSRFDDEFHVFGVVSNGDATMYKQAELPQLNEMIGRLKRVYGNKAALHINQHQNGGIEAIASIPL
jgi:sensor histidine kinase YesM